ncbi:MAG: InlB B-repeat-containing protein [Lachnospiraceae bacterium]|nr:InlB B-repeat-containing protein [Lachnospiraceae bacterium]
MKLRRGLALLAALILTVTAIPMDTLKAATLSETAVETEAANTLEETETVGDSLKEANPDEETDPANAEETAVEETEETEEADDTAVEDADGNPDEQGAGEVLEETPEESEEEQEKLGGTVTVTLDANGGKINGWMETMSKSLNEGFLSVDNVTLSSNDDSYWFCGWYAEPECTTRLSTDEYDDMLKETPEDGATLYAGYSNEYVEVTYDFGTEAYFSGPLGYYQSETFTDASVVYAYARKDRPLRSKEDSPGFIDDLNFEDRIHFNDLHYTLLGWSTEKNGEIVHRLGNPYRPTQDVTLYAVYNTENVVITFHANGGYYADGSVDQYSNLSNRTEELKEVVPKNSYREIENQYNRYAHEPRNADAKKAFTGWYTDENCTTPATLYTNSLCNEVWTGTGSYYYIKTEETDIHLYAGWADTNYVLTLNPNATDGYFRDDDTRNVRVVNKTVGGANGQETACRVYNPKREDKHYAFTGWYSDADCDAETLIVEAGSGYNYTIISYTLTANTTSWYAGWERKYNKVVTFDANGGKFDYYDEGVRVTDAETAQIRINDYGYLDGATPHNPKSTVAGKVFVGWYDGNTKVDLNNYEFSEDVTFKAKYADCYDVTLDYNGGYYREYDYDTNAWVQKSTKVIKVPKGESIQTYENYDEDRQIPEAKYTDDQKIFDGWYLSTDTGFKNRIDEYDYVPSGKITLKAHWLASYKVTFDARNGKINGEKTATYPVPENSILRNASGFAFPPNPTSTHPNKIFSGWFLDASCTQPITKTAILAYNVTSNVTFYAGYQEAVKIVFDLNDPGDPNDPKAYFVNSTIKWEAEEGKYGVKIIKGGSIRGVAPTVDTENDSKVFAGWYTDADCTEEVNIYTDTFSVDTTVYAGWADCYKVTFHLGQEGENIGGAKFADGTDGNSKVVKVIKGEPYRCARPFDYAEVARKDFIPEVIMGNEERAALPLWYDANDKPYNFGGGYFKNTDLYLYGLIPTCDMDFYLKWADTVNVTFDANGTYYEDAADASLYTNGFTYHGTVSDDQLTCVVSVPKGMKFGDVPRPFIEDDFYEHRYFEWAYEDAACKTKVNNDQVLNEDETVYGKWVSYGSGGSSSGFRLTFHAGEGYFNDYGYPTQSIQVYYPNNTTYWNYVRIPEHEDDDKVFIGWYTDAALTKPYSEKDTRFNRFYWGDMKLRFPKKVTNLYAKFGTANTVTFDANGGYFDDDDSRTIDPANDMRETTTLIAKAAPGQPVVASDFSTKVRRDGNRIFGGWYEDAACTVKATLYAVDWTEELYLPTKQNTTLYAKWIPYSTQAAFTISANGTDKPNLDIGETVTLTATVSDENKDAVHWFIGNYSASTDDIKPVKLGINGEITAQSKGTCSIYATVNGIRSTNFIDVTVSGNKLSATVSIRDENGDAFGNSPYLCVGDTLDITAAIEPKGLQAELAGNVQWTSSDPAVAAVEGSGLNATITAAGEGEADITATLGQKQSVLHIVVGRPIAMDVQEMILTSKADVSETVTVTLLKDIDLNTVTLEVVNSDGEVRNGIVTVTPADLKQETAWTVSDNIRTCALNIEPKDILYPETVFVKVSAVMESKPVSASCAVTVNPQQQVEKVTANVDGFVSNGTKVLLTSATAGADIYYAINDGAEIVYKGAITINEDQTIKAYAKKAGLKDSIISTFNYTLVQGNVAPEVITEFDGLDKVPTGIWYRIADRTYLGGGIVNLTEKYTGDKITFNDEVEVYHGTARLVENRDYTLTYANNINAAENNKMSGNKVVAPSVTVKGKGNYNASETFYFTIAPIEMDEATVTSEPIMTVAAGPKVKLSGSKPTVSYKGKKLTLGKDYDLQYYTGIDFDQLVENPDTTFLSEAGKSYGIKIYGKAGSNFKENSCIDFGEKTVIIQTIDAKDKTTVTVSTLKAGDAGGKALKFAYYNDASDAMKAYYQQGAIDLEKVFDNSEEGKKPLAFVYAKKPAEPLTYGVDYEIVTDDEIDFSNAGKYSFMIVGKGDANAAGVTYVGSKTVTFEVAGTPLSKVKIAGLSTSVEFTGEEIELDDLFTEDKVIKDQNAAAGTDGDKWQEIKLYTTTTEKDANNKKVTVYNALEEHKDYEVTLDNTGAVGRFDLIFEGKGAYTGTVKKTITVKAFNVKNNAQGKIEVTVNGGEPTYTKAGVKPPVTVSFDGDPLQEGIDYTVSYKNNAKIVEAATLGILKDNARPTVVITGKGNFTGTKSDTYFTIDKANAADTITLEVNDVAYNPKGKAGYFLVAPKLMDGGKAVAAGKNKDVEAITKDAYTYYYAEDTTLADGTTRKYAGTRLLATDDIKDGTLIEVRVDVTVGAASPYSAPGNKATLKGRYRFVGENKDISKATVKIKQGVTFTYQNGDEIIPLQESELEVTLKGQNEPLDADDFEIISVSNNRFLGTATATLRGKGEYGGIKTVTFKITAMGL